MKGHIKITDKVYFIPDELPKPILGISRHSLIMQVRKDHNYSQKMKAYEVSKKTVEVSNETYSVTNTTNGYWILLKKDWKIVKDNQEVEAEVTDTAIITKI